jgi:heme-degrading monooxygenase HmoA
VITRIFRVTVPAHLHGAFERDFLAVSVPFVKAASGLVSVSVGRPTRSRPDEYAMVSVWRDEGALAAFAGDQWERAVIPRGMEPYVSECWVHHYESFGP